MLFAEHQAQNDTLKRSTKNPLAILMEGLGGLLSPRVLLEPPTFLLIFRYVPYG